MEQKLFLLDGEGNKVSAILSSSENTTASIVIMCHGLNSGKDSATNLTLEKIFLKNNIATFRFDFFAHGESEGKIEDRSVGRFVDDILKIIDYLKSKDYKNIGIYGVSFGGVATVIAVSNKAEIRVMALKAPGMGQTSRKMLNYKNDFEKKGWIKAGSKISIPTLIVHGTTDKDVEVKFGKELAKAIKKSELKLYQNADHKFTKKEDFERMIKDISEFIIKHI